MTEQTVGKATANQIAGVYIFKSKRDVMDKLLFRSVSMPLEIAAKCDRSLRSLDDSTEDMDTYLYLVLQVNIALVFHENRAGVGLTPVGGVDQ